MTQIKFSLVGIYGGTFDPIHFGHLRIAEELLDLVGFDKINFMPSGTPRLRHTPTASMHQRAAMVRLAIQNNPQFILDEREINRSGVSASVTSLHEYRNESQANKALCFIIGIDAFIKLPQWDDWLEMFKLCHLIILGRPGYPSIVNNVDLPHDLQTACANRWVSSVNDLVYQSSGLIFNAPTTLLNISATSIRALISAGKSTNQVLPKIVADYIMANYLYSGEE